MSKKLNIGGQKGRKTWKVKNWIIIDIRKGSDIQMDIMHDPLPFKDNEVDAIYTSHTLEHIFPDKLPFICSEFKRVLKPGGLIRIVVPDIDKAIHAYVKGNVSYLEDKRNPAKMPWLLKHPLSYLSSWFWTYKISKTGEYGFGGHVTCFNYDLLKMYLENAGFESVKKLRYGKQSKIFVNCDFNRYKDCSIYAEASS